MTGSTVRARAPWWAQAGIALLGLAMLAAQTATPTPLYARYAERWALEPLAISTVFAAYVVGLTVALLCLGGLSDHVGRRPVALAALATALTAMAVLALASGFAGLVTGRVLQGLAAGLGMAAFGAALIDHAPVARRPAFAVANSALLPLATGLGAVVSALVLVRTTSLGDPYVVQGAGIALALVATLTLRECHPRRPGALRSLRPGLALPAEVRRTFVLAAAGVAASWSLVGLYLGLGPLVTGTVFGIDTPLAAALAVASASGTGGFASILTVRVPARRAMTTGCGLLLVASALVVVAVTSRDVTLYFTASTVGGVGFGCAFQAGLRTVVAAAPDEHRAGMLAALYLVSYVAFGVPSLAASVFAPVVGLQSAVVIYACLIATLTIGSLALGARR